MQQDANTQYKAVITQLIQKQMAILGPDITFAKLKKVNGISVDAQGVVTNISADPRDVLQEAVNQFVELSGVIVNTVMESIIAANPGLPISATFNQNVPSITISTPSEEQRSELAHTQEELDQAAKEVEQSPVSGTAS